MTRIAIIADGHFDEHSRFDECIRLHDWIAQDARERRVDLVLHAGDVFERKSTPKERLAFAAWVQEITAFAPLVIVRGNHDAVGDLPLFAQLETRYPVIVEERAGVHVVGDVAVGCLAWPRRAELVAAYGEQGHEATEQVAGDALRACLRGLGLEMSQHPGPRVLLTHAMVRGSMTSTGQPLVGCDMEIGLDDLALAGADVVALGHIHLGQEWTHGSMPIVYPGSPRRASYGEIEDKAYLVIDIDADGVRVERVVTPATPMLHVDAKMVDTDCMETGAGLRTLELDGDYPDVRGAEVRFRYVVPVDEQEHGKKLAAAWKERFLADGAIDVKVEPEVDAKTRARAPEIAAAPTLADKVRALWTSRGDTRAFERELARLTKVAALEEELGIGRDASAGGAPRFERIIIRGIGPFTQVDVDLSAISGLLVAVTGKNGAGKSTFLELLMGALLRDTPTRGTIQSLARTRDSMLQARVVNGAAYTIRHLVDAVSNKGDSVVTNEDGHTLTSAGQRKEYMTWAKGHFPSPEVMYASTFAAQAQPSFIDLTAGDRKKVLLRTLGIERLEVLAALASKKEAAAKSEVAKLEALLAEERTRALPLDEARAAVDDLTIEHEAAESDLADARRMVQETAEALSLFTRSVERGRELALACVKHERDLEEARERVKIARELAATAPEIAAARARIVETEARLEVERAAESAASRAVEATEQALRDARRATAERAIIEDRIAALDAALTRARTDLAALHPVISRADVIRAAQKRLVELEAELTVAREVYDARKAEKAEAEKAEGIANAAYVSAQERQTETRRVVSVLEGRLQNEAAVCEAAQAEKDAAAEAVRARREREEVAESLRTSKDDRIHDLRAGMQVIARNAGVPAQLVAQEGLDDDDARALRSEAAPVRMRELQVQADEADRRYAECRKLAGQLDAVTQARADLDTARSAVVAADEAAARAGAAVADAEGIAWAARQAVEVAARAGQALRAEHTRLAGDARDAEALATAEARRTALEADIARIAGEQTRERDALPGLGEVDITGLEAALAAARNELGERAGVVARTTVLLRSDRETLLSADDVARAGADLEAATRDVDRESAEIKDLHEAMKALPSTDIRPDVSAARQAETAAQSRAKAAAAELARAQAAHEASQVSATKLAAFERDLATEYADLADWTCLAKDLGKDGIQALEIDAAGPELTAIANDLLHTCVSRRWTIAIHTQRLNHDGKKMIEGCEVEITDVEAGRIGAAETFSGGERVLIGEAVSLALSVLACRRAGVEGCSLIRDESGAALDAANGRAYIAMLRKAAVLIGARQVLYVSHTPELQELADARIHIENGTARVVPVDYVGCEERPEPLRNVVGFTRADTVRSLNRLLEIEIPGVPAYERLAE